jgi:hypothetical protein
MFKDNPPLFREAMMRFLKKQKDMGTAKAAPVHLNYHCRAWLGYSKRDQYGRFSFTDKELTNGIEIHGPATHFAFYMIHRKEIRKGKIITHACQMNWCVEPSHLREGTPKSNALEALFKRKEGNIPLENKTWNTTTENAMIIKLLYFQYGHDVKSIKEMVSEVSLQTINSIISGRTWWGIDITNLLTEQGGKRKK